MKTLAIIYLAVLLSATCNKNKTKDQAASEEAIDSAITETIDTPPPAPIEPNKKNIMSGKASDIPNEEPLPPGSRQRENTATTQNAGNYRVIISFISKASGVDRELHRKFKELLAAYSPSVTPDITPWGREGEVDYCMKLNELTQQQQRDFIQKVRNIVGNTDMVFIKENAQCVHKR